jgi:transcriptional regulator with XRE-family HTH domain
MSETKMISDPEMDRQRARIMGNKIYKARVKRWLYISEGASALNMPASTLANYERGDRLDVLARWMNNMERILAPILGVNVNFLLGMTDDDCTEETWRANQRLGKEISTLAGSQTGLFPFQLENDGLRPKHKKGEVLLFEPTDYVDTSQGGLYAVEIDGAITPRLFSRNVDGEGWRVKDGVSEETITDETMCSIKIKGVYRCKVTDL